MCPSSPWEEEDEWELGEDKYISKGKQRTHLRDLGRSRSVELKKISSPVFSQPESSVVDRIGQTGSISQDKEGWCHPPSSSPLQDEATHPPPSPPLPPKTRHRNIYVTSPEVNRNIPVISPEVSPPDWESPEDATLSPRLPKRSSSLTRSCSLPPSSSPFSKRRGTRKEVKRSRDNDEERSTKYSFYTEKRDKRDSRNSREDDEDTSKMYPFHPGRRESSPALVITEMEDTTQLRPCLKAKSRESSLAKSVRIMERSPSVTFKDHSQDMTNKDPSPSSLHHDDSNQEAHRGSSSDSSIDLPPLLPLKRNSIKGENMGDTGGGLDIANKWKYLENLLEESPVKTMTTPGGTLSGSTSNVTKVYHPV